MKTDKNDNPLDDPILQKASKEVKREREMLKGRTFREKIQYFFMYYWIPFVIVLVVIAIVVSILVARSRHRDYAFHADLINAETTIHDGLLGSEFGAALDIDNSKYQVSIDSSMEISGTSMSSVGSTEKLSGEINSEILDVCMMPEELFLMYADEHCFGTLTEFLTEEQLDEYADLIVYVEDIPVGILVEDFYKIEQDDLYSEEDHPVLGIIYNTPHPEECSLFIDYLNEP